MERFTLILRSAAILMAGCGMAIGQTLTLEDWACYTFTNATSVSGGLTNLTCNAPHGWGNPGATIALNIYGGTGAWSAIDTWWENVTNPLPIGATDTKIQVNDTRWLNVPSMVLLDNEQIWVASVDSHYLYLGPTTGCTTGRGCNGTKATTHVAQDLSWIYNYTSPNHWTATIIDPVTIQIALNSSTFGSLSGQSIYTRRSDVYQPDMGSAFYQVYLGQPWASYDQVGPNGLTITIPQCASTTDPNLCSVGFLTPFNGKGYSYGDTDISSFVVSNGYATVMFRENFTDQASNAILTPVASAGPSALGAFLWVQGMNESATGLNSLNHGYLVQSIITSGSNKIGAVIGPVTLPNGTYSPAVPTNCNDYHDPSYPTHNYACVTMPWPGDPYSNVQDIVGGSLNTYPNSTVGQFLKNGGTWSPTVNRARLMMQWNGVNRAALPGGGTANDFGTYEFFGTDPTDLAHMYHSVDYPIVSGAWLQLEWTAAFEHVVGASAPYYYQNQAMENGGWLGSPAWRGGVRQYYDALQRFYLDESTGDPTVGILDGSTMTIKKIDFYQASNEPEEYVEGRSILYNGTQYLLGWQGPRQDFTSLPVTYQVRYSTSDMKSTGFSKGTSGGTVANSQNVAPYGASVNYASPAMAQSGTIYFGIRPIAPILAVSGNGASPIWFWSYLDYNMAVGDHITTSGVGGAGNVTATAISAYQPRQVWPRFQPNSTQPWTTPGTLTSVSSDNSGNCTTALTVNHNLTVGWPVYLVNAPTGGPANGIYNVTSVPSSKNFVFACPKATPNTTWNTDEDSLDHFGITSLPGVAVAGTASGISPSSPTLIPTDDNKNFAEIIFSPPSTVCTITSPTLPNGTVGTAYSQSLQSSSCLGSLTWSISSGSLCGGLTLSSTTGSITGTSNVAENCSFGVTVKDSFSHTATQTFSIKLLSPCDLNGDGTVNGTDVSLAQQMALGTAACTLNLAGDGCTIVDVQRVIDAANGGTCVVGP